MNLYFSNVYSFVTIYSQQVTSNHHRTSYLNGTLTIMSSKQMAGVQLLNFIHIINIPIMAYLTSLESPAHKHRLIKIRCHPTKVRRMSKTYHDSYPPKCSWHPILDGLIYPGYSVHFDSLERSFQRSPSYHYQLSFHSGNLIITFFFV